MSNLQHYAHSGNHSPFHVIRERLKNLKRSGDGYSARCPAHGDRHNSLSVSEGKGGRVLLNCHAGCDTEEVVEAMGLRLGDLFPHEPNGSQPRPPTVEALASDKGLPESFLRTLGVKEISGGLQITYFLEDGAEAPRQRKRTALEASKGSFWMGPSGAEIVPYGLQYLDYIREEGYALLVEGETDVLTLFFHEFPALGIPGASMACTLKRSYLEGLSRLYIVREPDQGGNAFVRGLTKRLKELGFTGEAYAVAMPEGIKDPNELHKQNPGGFKDRFTALMDETTPLVLSSSAEADEEVEIDDIPGFPERAFDLLPSIFREVLDFFEKKHKKDLILTSLLAVLAACMPKVEGRYGGRKYAPAFFIGIIARAASGKGDALWAKRLADLVHDEIASSASEQGRSFSNGEEQPHLMQYRGLFLPANVSSSALLSALEANGGRGLLMDTEADTLTLVLKQKWASNLSPVLRKAFEHEPASLLRNDRIVEIEWPRFSIFLSGTPGQFRRLFRSVENGLFSRFCFFLFESPLQWVSQKPGTIDKDREAFFEGAAEKVYALYRQLSERENPLSFELTDEQWTRHTKAFKSYFEEVKERGVDENLLSCVKRAGVVAFRVAMVLGIWRSFEEDSSLSDLSALHPSDEDVEAAITIALTFADHGLRLGAKLPHSSSSTVGSKGEVSREFFERLPEAFERKDAVAIMEDLGKSKPTADRYLRDLVRQGKLEKEAHGHYRKKG